MKRELLSISQILENHPMKDAKPAYKAQYISLLRYYAKYYSEDDLWTESLLKLYQVQLFADIQPYEIATEDVQKLTRKISAAHFKFWGFYSYWCSFAIDLFFINAFDDQKKAAKIKDDLCSMLRPAKAQLLQTVFDALYDNVAGETLKKQNIDSQMACWIRNRNFLQRPVCKVLITANMSAGKSTLLNAIVGKKVNKTKNEACTAKVHYIVSKAFEDGFIYEWDHNLELNADEKILMDDNEENASDRITVGSYFRTPLPASDAPLWLIDTPGVNSSRDAEHKEIAGVALKNIQADMLIYLLNATQLGTVDDARHLSFIRENYKGKIIFVVNKLDEFRTDEDSVPEALKSVKVMLEDIGFQEPLVLPISARCGYLAKRKLYEDDLDRYEEMEFEFLCKSLNQTEYQFDTYYTGTVQTEDSALADSDAYQLLLHSGILSLENILYKIGEEK